MRTIAIKVLDADFNELEEERRAEGLKSVSTLVLRRLGLTEDNDLRGLCDTAVLRGRRRTEPFYLRELFDRDEWNAFPTETRLRAGRVFYHRVMAGKDGLQALPKRKRQEPHRYSAMP